MNPEEGKDDPIVLSSILDNADAFMWLKLFALFSLVVQSLDGRCSKSPSYILVFIPSFKNTAPWLV